MPEAGQGLKPSAVDDAVRSDEITSVSHAHIESHYKHYCKHVSADFVQRTGGDHSRFTVLSSDVITYCMIV